MTEAGGRVSERDGEKDDGEKQISCRKRREMARNDEKARERRVAELL